MVVSRRERSRLLLLVTALGVLAQQAQADVVQVHVLARHGLRNPFERDEIQVWDDGGQLSGHGYAQMAAMGGAFRDRYLGGGRTAPGLNQTGLARTSLVRSTDSLTSMMSATAFMIGMVPPGSGPVDELTGKAALPGQLDPVGVHTVPMALDIPLRAYDKCPLFHDGLDALMASPEIAAWESQHGPALAKLGQHARVANVSAVTFLDAFEIVAVEHGFGNLTNITETEYGEYEKMAAFIGEKMFAGAETSRMLAGRLLANMAQLIAMAVDVHNATIPFIYLSGQYPTIMATHSALGVYGSSLAGIPAELPSPGSALIIELHEKPEQSFAVRILVHDPSRGRNFTEVALDRCGSQVLCPLDKFMPLLSTVAIAEPAEWCALCNNTMTPPCSINKTVSVPVPGPCTPADPAEAGAGTGPNTAQDVANGNDRSTAFAILTGVGFGLLLAIVIYATVRCVKSGVVSERLLPRVQEAWRGRSNRTPNHVELQALLGTVINDYSRRRREVRYRLFNEWHHLQIYPI